MAHNQPGLRQRLQLAWQVYQRGMPAKAAPFRWAAQADEKPQWSGLNYESYATAGYGVNAVIHACVMYKVRAGTAAPLRAWTGPPDAPVPLAQTDPDHPLVVLLERPNAFSSWIEFQALNTVYLNLAGNCYIYLDRPKVNGPPATMYSLRPDRVKIVPSNSALGKEYAGVRGYLYYPYGHDRDPVPLVPEDLIHIKYPHPLDQLEGMGYGQSPVQAAAYSGDVDNAVTKFLKLFFERGTMLPGGLLTYDKPLTDAVIARIRERWQERYGGYEAWAQEIGVLDQGGKYERMTATFEEMGFEVLDERNEARLHMVFGVPPILTGSRLGMSKTTFDNYRTARQSFWEDTMLPENRLFEVDFQYFLGWWADVWLAFDYSAVPAFAAQRDERIAQLAAAWQSTAATRNEYRAALGLHPDPVQGDVYLDPYGMSRQPAVFMPAPAAGGAEIGPTEERPAGAGATVDATTDERAERARGPRPKQRRPQRADKDRWATTIDQKARGDEADYARAVGRAFREIAAGYQVVLTTARDKMKRRKAAPEWPGIADEMLRFNEPEIWARELAPVMEATMLQTGAYWAGELGLPLPTTIRAAAWFDDYVLVFAQRVSDTTREAIAGILQQATTEGWSIDLMQSRLDQVFRHWLNGNVSPEDLEWLAARMPQYRRELIARTEALRAANGAAHRFYREWKIDLKEWWATADDRTRDSHYDAWLAYQEGGTPGPLPLDEAFIVGGSRAQYPGDPALPVGEVANCRCVLLPFQKIWREVDGALVEGW